ncbi:hypothetical protein GGR57DRAFT_481292 [Xylariaceae sp. FL1272]|nr:hypothetical protein GGR57DRAFT_481292 [Xylariaceae sp. FL1272]
MLELISLAQYVPPHLFSPQPTTLSPLINPARMLLNFKGLPYSTTWLEYPSIAPTLSSLGIPPHTGPGAYISHSLPAIKLYETYIMDSLPIAHAVEAAYPSPPLHLDSPLLPQVIASVTPLIPTLKSTIMATVPREILNPVSATYWRDTRSKFLGMSVEELERTADKDAEWEAAKTHLDVLAELLRKTEDEGPFFLGETPSYADIVFAAFLKSASVYSTESFQKIVTGEEGFRRLFDAMSPWMERDD